VTLRVVLADGTRLPFVLAASPTEVDVQVRVARSGPSRPALVSTVWREHVWAPREGRAGRLAEVMLGLAGRSGPGSSDVASAVWRPGAGLELERRPFHAGGLSGFVVRVRNPDPLRPWEPGEVRVRHAEGRGEVEVQALRMEPASLPPGGWGWLVVVTGALPRDEGARFELELRGRGGARKAPPEGVAL
jgi:hypothetical protein